MPNTNPATGEPMDTPTVDELYQGDEETDVRPVFVEVTNAVRTDQLPRILGKMDTVPFTTAAGASQILGNDPRRAEVTLWATGGDIVLASNRGSAEARLGATLSSGVGTPIHLSARSELWAIPAAGNVDTAFLSIIEEMWAR